MHCTQTHIHYVVFISVHSQFQYVETFSVLFWPFGCCSFRWCIVRFYRLLLFQKIAPFFAHRILCIQDLIPFRCVSLFLVLKFPLLVIFLSHSFFLYFIFLLQRRTSELVWRWFWCASCDSSYWQHIKRCLSIGVSRAFIYCALHLYIIPSRTLYIEVRGLSTTLLNWNYAVRFRCIHIIDLLHRLPNLSLFFSFYSVFSLYNFSLAAVAGITANTNASISMQSWMLWQK